MSDDRPALARTTEGNRIHLTTCRHARASTTATRWTWADDRNSGEIARAITAHDLQPCRQCKPIAALARWEHAQRAASRPTGAAPTTAELLDFERTHPGTSGRKHEEIRVQLGLTAGRYWQLLRAAVRTEEALLHDAQLTHQLDARIRAAAADRAARLRRHPA